MICNGLEKSVSIIALFSFSTTLKFDIHTPKVSSDKQCQQIKIKKIGLQFVHVWLRSYTVKPSLTRLFQNDPDWKLSLHMSNQHFCIENAERLGILAPQH